MSKPCLVVSTCGTSLLTNNVSPELRNILTDFANELRAEDVPFEPRRRIQQHLESRSKELIHEMDLKHLMDLSAELNGVIRFYGGNPKAARDQHILLATDTWLGESTARIVSDILKRYGHIVEIKRVRDLRTDNADGFRWAISDLVAWCAETLKGYRDSGYRVVFNLTGGFKSVQGFMQALGMIYADESIYVFERTDQLLRLPRLPVQLDSEAILRRHLAVFRRIAAGLKVKESEVPDVPESLLNVDELAIFSPWGELVWQEAYRDIYSIELLEPISFKLKFTPQFRRSLEGLAADRLRHVNERLDQLARCLEENAKYNPSSLDFKPLQGTDHKGSTHECDAWSDCGAFRLFGHFEGGCYVIDRLDKGLH